ncbi:MAG: hypothetical protein ABSB19_03550 [Methylomonas sp.]
MRAAISASLLFGALSSAAQADVVAGAIDSGSIGFNANDLVVPSSYYTGAATPIQANVTQLSGASAGQTVTASSGSAYNTVWLNHAGTNADASFGVTSPIYMSNVNTTTRATDSASYQNNVI